MKATTVSGSTEERQIYAYLTRSFCNADVDKEGWLDDTGLAGATSRRSSS